MSNDALIDRLVEDLRPVPPPAPGRLVALLVALVAVELAAFLALGTMRPDIGTALGRVAFWWKMGGLGLLASMGASVALRSFDPVVSPRRGLRRWAVVLVGLLLLGAAIGASRGSGDLPARLMWRMGIECVTVMTLLSVLPIVALGLMMRRGAPTDRPASAIAVGLAAAASGAFIFAFHCPSDDPVYIVFWYALGCGLITLVARVVLPLATRW